MANPLQISGIPVSGTGGDVELDSRHYKIQVDKTDNAFSDMLSDAINGVDNAMKTAEQGVENYVAGKSDNVADVMINMQRAQLSFQLMVEVRNKAIEAYSELSRMQI
ncbi:MAG: flagellar hook-basal body complex protein FliE [Bacteroidota bacterium]